MKNNSKKNKKNNIKTWTFLKNGKLVTRILIISSMIAGCGGDFADLLHPNNTVDEQPTQKKCSENQYQFEPTYEEKSWYDVISTTENIDRLRAVKIACNNLAVTYNINYLNWMSMSDDTPDICYYRALGKYRLDYAEKCKQEAIDKIESLPEQQQPSCDETICSASGE